MSFVVHAFSERQRKLSHDRRQASLAYLRYCSNPLDTVGLRACIWYDGAIMMARTQITLERETHKRARQRASELGVSLAEYFRRLVRKDLGTPEKKADVSVIFNLGDGGGDSDIANRKDEMIADAIWGDLERGRRR